MRTATVRLPATRHVREVLLVVALAGCAGYGAAWHRPPAMPEGQLPERQRVQVWGPESMVELHGVTITADSVSGVPFFRPPDCDSCRVAFPRSMVDSIRFGDALNRDLNTVGVLILVGAAAALTVSFVAALKGT